MTNSTGEPDVVDVPSERRLVVREPDGTAELVYEVEDGRLVLVHTGVPDELGGRGIGGRLVQAAIDKADREHLAVVPVCPFARRWLRNHPEAAGSTTIDWNPTRPRSQ